MAETVNILLQIPPRGGSAGVWDVPINGDFSAIDGWLGGVTSISLTNSNVTLTKPTGTVTAGAGPTQAENAVIKLSGTLSGNVVITLPMPGKYIVKNSCVVGAFYVQSRALGTGNMVGLPEGRSVTIWNDGTDVDFADAPEVGSALDLHCNTTTLPAWMTACSVQPYLIKNGGIHTAALYPALAGRLGSTYGGNGASTFGVPDEMSRIRLPVDSSGSAARITTAICGINGTTFGSAGGDQRISSHNHTTSVTDPGHQHPSGNLELVQDGSTDNVRNITVGGSILTGSATTNISVSVASTGLGSSQNMPPAIVSFLPLVKT